MGMDKETFASILRKHDYTDREIDALWGCADEMDSTIRDVRNLTVAEAEAAASHPEGRKWATFVADVREAHGVKC